MGDQPPQPTPEEIFEGRKVNLYLTDAALDLPVNCVKGIRAVLSHLEGERVPISVAHALWERYQDALWRPVLLGYANGPDEAKAAAEHGVAASGGNLVIGYGLDAADIRRIRREHGVKDPGPEQDEEGPVASAEKIAEHVTPVIDPDTLAAKQALVLMAMNDGSPTKSHIFAKILARNSGDSTWTDAANLIDGAFPQVVGGDD